MNTILMSAVLFRLRGSDLFSQITGKGATTARLLWSLHLALSIYLVSNIGFGWFLALWFSLWLGSVAEWWQSLGVRTWQEVARHSLRGALWMAPSAAVVWLAGSAGDWPDERLAWLWPVLAGGLAGPVYLACRLAWPKLAVESAELIWGGMIAASLVVPVVIEISERIVIN